MSHGNPACPNLRALRMAHLSILFPHNGCKGCSGHLEASLPTSRLWLDPSNSSGCHGILGRQPLPAVLSFSHIRMVRHEYGAGVTRELPHQRPLAPNEPVGRTPSRSLRDVVVSHSFAPGAAVKKRLSSTAP